MAPTIGQIAAASFAAVRADKRKPHNQWAQSSFLAAWEKLGGLQIKSFGNNIEVPMDYRRNPGAKFLNSELETVSTAATEVLTAATTDFAELSVPVFWSKRTEVANPTTAKKVDIVDSLLSNSFDSHDDLIEQAMFATTTNGFLGLATLITAAGTGTIHGIDSSAETWFRNAQATYVDETDIEAALNTAWYAASKGTGSPGEARLLVSNGATLALFEGTQQGLQRYDSQNFKAGATALMYKTAQWVFSQYGDTNIYGLSPKNMHTEGSKEYFREKSEVQEMENANGFGFKIYSALQNVVTNRSRLFVVHT